MNAATIIIGIIVAILFILAVRYLHKHGTCAGCSEKNACHGDSGGKSSGACSGCCSHCNVCNEKHKL